jgi:hypothetical protein
LKTCIALALLTLASSASVSALADQTRFSIGAGVTSAGTVSGGFVLAPTFSYGWRISDQWEVAMTGRTLVTGLVYRNPGVVIHNAPTLGFTWASGYVVAGPSFDILATVLCGANNFCNRVSGVAPGATLGGAVFFDALRERVGVYIDGHLTVVPRGAVYDGALVTVTAGPVLRLGLLTK